jgi:hypothetical protein
MTRPAPFRKSDLKPAFEAALDAGFDEVRVEVETPEGMRYQIVAGKTSPLTAGEKPTPLEEWRANRGVA